MKFLCTKDLVTSISSTRVGSPAICFFALKGSEGTDIFNFTDDTTCTFSIQT